MTAIHVEVPAHVQHVDHTSNGVQVRGGTNWDLSRTAVETPISRVADPQPVRPAADLAPKYLPSAEAHSTQAVTVQFGINSAVVPATAQKLLKKIPKGSTVTVTGHSDAAEKEPALTAERRADAVANFIRKQGSTVESSKALSTHVPAAGAKGAAGNRRVEVLVK